MRVRATEDDTTVQDFMIGAITRELTRRDRLAARRHSDRTDDAS
jgi:hypothetical protein